MEPELKILFVEDVLSDVELIWHDIEKNSISFTKKVVSTRDEYIDAINIFNPDIILSDYSLPQFDGMEALAIRNEKVPDTPFILVTGSVNEEIAVECMKAGADDYILKDNLSRLGPAIVNARNKIDLLKEKEIAESAFRSANERLSTIFNVLPAATGIERDGQIVEVNPFLCSITGFSIEELIGSDYRILFHDTDDFENTRTESLRQIKAEGESKMETCWRKKDGSTLDILIASAFLDSNNPKQGILFTAVDISDRKSAENKHLKSEVRLKKAQEIAHVGNLELSVAERIVWCSEEALRIYGLTGCGNEIPFSMIEERTLPRYYDMVRDSFQTLLKYNEAFEVEYDITRKNDGAIRSLFCKMECVVEEQNSVLKVLAVVQDITERKQIVRDLISAKEKAEESDRLKTAFLHNISHEIRTPMNAIVGFSYLLNEPGMDDESRQSYVDIILQSSNHLLSIITDIVEISNIDAKLVTISKNEFNLNMELNNIIEEHRSKLEQKPLEILFEPSLIDSDSLIVTDGTKLKQVVYNLINNAIKFTNEGVVKLGYEIKDTWLEFCIADTGIGIPKENHEKIFKPFYQVQNSIARLYEGTGLGLAITKAYVALLGGDIWIESEPEKGSSFYFKIPLEKSIHEHTTKGIRDQINPDAMKTLKKILIAEDIESNFKLLKYFLAGTGLEIIRAVNGKEAVDKYNSESDINLILMDIKMPVMDGYTAARIIREQNSTIPIIAQTAYVEDKEKAYSSGCTGFISKPFDKKGLLSVISEYI